MVSQRGQIVLAHQPGAARHLGAARQHHAAQRHRRRAARPRRGHEARCPISTTRRRRAGPIWGGILQRRAGTVRHDAVAWGYARAADPLGVDIIENCEVTGFVMEDGQGVGVETSRGRILARQDRHRGGRPHLACREHGGPAAAGREPHPAGLRHRAGEAHGAIMSSPGAPSSSTSRSPTRAASSSAAISTASTPTPSAASSPQSRPWPNAPCRSCPSCRGCACCATGAASGHDARRQPLHLPDADVKNLYLNGGWCYQGFKATPASGWTFAHTIAHDEEHELNRCYALDRFEKGGSSTTTASATGPTSNDESRAPIAASATYTRIPLRRRCHEAAARAWRGRSQGLARLLSSSSTIPKARIRNTGSMCWAAGSWFRLNAQHRHQRDRRQRRHDERFRSACRRAAASTARKPITFTLRRQAARRLCRRHAGLGAAGQWQDADVGRSFKYHRPRGIVSAGIEEPNGLFTWARARAANPTFRRPLTDLIDGLVARARTPGRRRTSI